MGVARDWLQDELKNRLPGLSIWLHSDETLSQRACLSCASRCKQLCSYDSDCYWHVTECCGCPNLKDYPTQMRTARHTFQDEIQRHRWFAECGRARWIRTTEVATNSEILRKTAREKIWLMKIVVVVLSKYSRNGNRIFCWTLRNPFTFRQVNDLRTLALLDRLTSELSIDAFAAFVPISARPLKTMHDKGV